MRKAIMVIVGILAVSMHLGAQAWKKWPFVTGESDA
jgi:hypothetical protein